MHHYEIVKMGKLYRRPRFDSERDRVDHLFVLYEKMKHLLLEQ